MGPPLGNTKPDPESESSHIPSKDEPPSKKRKFQQYTPNIVPEREGPSHTHLPSTPYVTNSSESSQLLGQTSELYQGHGPIEIDQQYYDPEDYANTVLPPTVEKLANNGFDRGLLEAHEGANTSQGKSTHEYMNEWRDTDWSTYLNAILEEEGLGRQSARYVGPSLLKFAVWTVSRAPDIAANAPVISIGQTRFTG
ncbi:hypothetical protein FA13DRAFT_1784376 [Coprinellus micaceus]|uniref:Uncharacterized protein n=1 Tax=Coprinellus micaceus TaxID=71717 RepID=A0A4Y7U096_COPMI|nr:hypothetical protein FA13DRAFT_1784376 [Coprinellus micaceus]